MGYRPNILVHSIRSGRSRSIGVMVHPHDSYWTQVLYGIHDRLIEADHIPLLLWDREHDPAKSSDFALSQIHRLLDRRVDGAIFWPHFAQLYAHHVVEFHDRQLPVVTIDHRLPRAIRSDAVLNDEALIGRLLIEHLAAHGHRRAVLLSGPVGVTWADGRVAKVLSVARSLWPALQLAVARVPYGSTGEAEAQQQLAQQNRPTAVIAGTDHFAVAVYAVARRLGLQIPRDLSVIGVGDLAGSRELWPALTTIRQDGYETGRRAAGLVLRRCLGSLSQSASVIEKVPVTLVERDSVADATE